MSQNGTGTPPPGTPTPSVPDADRAQAARRARMMRRARKAAVRRMGHRSLSESQLMADSGLGEGEDPMSGLGNLSDAMLVFACGLLIALVVYWNVDLTVTQILEEEKLTEVDEVEELSEEMVNGTAYTERGTVYEDPNTGELYLLEPNDKKKD